MGSFSQWSRSFKLVRCTHACVPTQMNLPFALMVSKLTPMRGGNRNVFLEKSHVPSPMLMVSELYVAEPAGDKTSGAGAMAVE